MSEKNDYPYIRRYGLLLSSHDHYVRDQIQQARADNAPSNAVYKSSGKWKTTDDIASDTLRRDIGLGPLPTSKLPATYTVTIDVDRSRSDDPVQVAVYRHGRRIYRGRFDTYAEGAKRAEMEIGFNFARTKD